MGNKYEIDVDGDHDMEDHSSNIREEGIANIKSYRVLIILCRASPA